MFLAVLPLLFACDDSAAPPFSGDPIQITTSSLPSGGVGNPYSAGLAATGGTGSHAWSIESGSLPGGLSLTVAGVIAGTPIDPGTSSFTVKATSAGASATRGFSIAILPPAVAITTTTLAVGEAGAPYAATLGASGGNGSYSWTLASGSLPAGLSLSGTGVISGVPTAAGTSNFTVQAASGGRVATRALAITIALQQLGITTAVLPAAVAGVPYTATLAASGGAGNYAWALADGALPDGLSLSASGILAGTAGTAGTSSFTVRVTSGGLQATRALSLTVQSPSIAITTSALPGATVGAAYAASLLATGGDGTFTWNLTGGALPAGLGLSAAGIISGTPAAAGVSSFTVAVSSGGQTASHALTLTVVLPPVGIATATLPAATVGTAYSQQLAATGGTGSYAWSIAAGSLPAGLSLSSGGLITGTPTAAGTSAFTVRAASGGGSTTRDLSIVVAFPPVVIGTTALPRATIGQQYRQALAATGGDGSYAWSLTAGSLPAGLTLSASGVIAGTPTTAGTSSFTVRAASGGQADSARLSLTVDPAVSNVVITTASLPAATVGLTYSQTLAATGGTGSYAWTLLSGSLPAGLGLSAAGVISGTPTTAGGPASFTVQAASGTRTDTATLSIMVGYPPVQVGTTNLPDGATGMPYSATLSATGGDGNYTWSLAPGSAPLPAGLALSASGTISGTPTVPGTSSFTVEAASAGLLGTGSVSITIVASAQPVSITTTSLPDATEGQAYSQTLAATGGDGAYAWSVSAGALPAGLSLSGGGVLSGTPAAPGTSAFTVQATSAGSTDSRDLTLTVVAAPPLTVVTSSLPDGQRGIPYTQTLVASGGTGSYQWNAVGPLPPGLALSASGDLAGTPSSPGNYSLTVRVTSGAQSATATMSLRIRP